MELTKTQKQMVNNAVRECCKNADCATMSRIFDCAEWTWRDRVTDNDYTPTDREIMRSLYELGKNCLDSLIEDVRNNEWDETNPNPYTMKCGRLYFSIDWSFHNDDGIYDIVSGAEFLCGIEMEASSTTICDISQDSYIVETYADDENYRELYETPDED